MHLQLVLKRTVDCTRLTLTFTQVQVVPFFASLRVNLRSHWLKKGEGGKPHENQLWKVTRRSYNCFKVRFSNPIEFSQSFELPTSSFFWAAAVFTPIMALTLLSRITGRWKHKKTLVYSTFALSYQHLCSRLFITTKFNRVIKRSTSNFDD